MKTEFTYKNLFSQYSEYKEDSIVSKYIPHDHLKNLIEKLPQQLFQVNEVGQSVAGREIFSVKIGNGKTTVLLWSQMHGNESTATMAMFDIFNFFSTAGLFDKFRKTILSNLTIYFIPMLNPDGAENFERENAIGIDLNRDASRFISPESKLLNHLHKKIKPAFAFNLHDQENKHAVSESKMPAVISFLAPPFNFEREINSVRKKIMQIISEIKNVLSEFIPGHIGRYSDEFEPRAFGDNFVKWGTSSILIESGGWKNEPEKQFQRKLNFVSILSGLFSISTNNYVANSIDDYNNIPENKKLMFDVLLKNLRQKIGNENYNFDVGITREEKFDVKLKTFYFVSRIEEIGDLSGFAGYTEIDCSGMFVEPGKISVEKEIISDKFSEEQLHQFYSDGITCVQTIDIDSAKDYSNCGINFILNSSFENRIKINFLANLIIKSKDEIMYAVVNGFVYNVKEKSGQVKNGVIVK